MTPAPFTLAAVVQGGRLGFEALLLLATLRAQDPGFAGRVVLMEPQPGPLWPTDPRLPDGPLRAALEEMGAAIVPFDSRHFGAAYPQGNKIEGLAALPPGPFLFLDTDTFVTGPLSALELDWNRPSASLRVGPSWPDPPPYGADLAAIWGAVYAHLRLDMAGTLDPARAADDWRRYLYFNAGWFHHADPQVFAARFLAYALAIRDGDLPELVCQSLYPWLDQIALPPTVHALGGGRPGPGAAALDDGRATWHWRHLPLFYATAPEPVVDAVEAVARQPALRRLLRDWEPARRFLLQGHGRKAQRLFDRACLPPSEMVIRRRLKAEGLWLRDAPAARKPRDT